MLAPAMALLPGSRVGRYQIVGPLGAGGMGEVYRAHDPQLGRDIALKVLPEALAADTERVARFEREARILATLNHPNIATLYGIEVADGVPALVMELVDGETLHEHLGRHSRPGRGLPPAESVAIARQIADALDAAHERGIVHRDLKPANITVTSSGAVKVLDFGLAKAVVTSEPGDDQSETRSLSPAETRPHQVMGTVAYMSPEQARGQPVDRRTDIWAFGCVLYEMLAGRPAFMRATPSDTIAAVLTAEVEWAALPETTPLPLRQLIGRCLERHLRARLRDIGDARPSMDEALATPSPDIAAAPAPASRGGVSRRAFFAGSAAVGLVGAGLGATLTVPGPAPVSLPSYQRLTFRRGMIRTARFGPDFQTVLYGALWDGDTCRVYTVRPDSPESAPIALPSATPMAVSSTGEMALSLGSHLRGIMTYGTLARVPLAGGAPRALQEDVKYADWTPDGRELAIVRGLGDRDVLECPAGTVIAEPASPGGFSFPRVSPRGDTVAVVALDNLEWLVGKVVIFDRAGRRVAETRPYFNVFGLAWHGDEVWFTAADELPLLRNAVHAMDTRGHVRIVARVPGNTSLHDIAPDGRVLIARTEDRGGISVRTPGATAERDLSWLDAAFLTDMSPDGGQVLFWEGGVGGGPRNSVYLRGTDGSPAVRLGDGVSLGLSRDGRWALARTTGPHLDVLPTGAGSMRRLERAGLDLLSGRWLPDGRQVIGTARAGETVRLYLLDVEGSGVKAVTPEGLSVVWGWALSPDGRMVAVNGGEGPRLYDLTGGASRPVPGVGVPWRVVGWIESGLLVAENPAAAGTVERIDLATGRRDTWANIQPQDPAGIMSLTLSTLVTTPDGRGYGVTWHRATSDLYLVRGWT